jgi:hypothetical protein
MVFPSVTRPSRSVAPAEYKIASASEVFPLPACPQTAMFLMFSVLYIFMVTAAFLFIFKQSKTQLNYTTFPKINQVFE